MNSFTAFLVCTWLYFSDDALDFDSWAFLRGVPEEVLSAVDIDP